jgi:predicted O-methyltransferase YrrM
MPAMNERVRDTIDRLERFMTTVDDAKAIPREAAQFVHALVLATGATSAIEIGTSYGYSGTWIAAALADTGGRLITIDHDPRKAAAAAENFAAAGLLDRVDIRTGEARDILEAVQTPVDFVLNDADKENLIPYVELLFDHLTDRSVILTDNTLTHPEQLADFLGWIRRHEDFRSAQVPVGNGMEMSVKCVASAPG